MAMAGNGKHRRELLSKNGMEIEIYGIDMVQNFKSFVLVDVTV